MPSGWYCDSRTATWTNWNVKYYSTATNTTTSDSPWTEWCSSGTTSVTTATVWVNWNKEYEVYDVVQLEQPVQETAAEIAARAEQYRIREAELRKEAEEQAELAKEAEARAEQLLTEHLNAEQREQFQRERRFTVISKDGQRRYRINTGYSRNIERIDEAGKRLKTLCAHPKEQLPDYDHMLAQKLMLEHSEDEFLQIANVS